MSPEGEKEPPPQLAPSPHQKSAPQRTRTPEKGEAGLEEASGGSTGEGRSEQRAVWRAEVYKQAPLLPTPHPEGRPWSKSAHYEVTEGEKGL